MNPQTGTGAAPRSYRYYDFVMAAFVTVLLCSNFIGAAKQATVSLPLLGEVTFGAGVLFFPISYISATSSPRSMVTAATGAWYGPASQRSGSHPSWRGWS